MAELVDALDSAKLSAPLETVGVELLKVGEGFLLQSNANTEPSPVKGRRRDWMGSI